jgi:hypothetical protein
MTERFAIVYFYNKANFFFLFFIEYWRGEEHRKKERAKKEFDKSGGSREETVTMQIDVVW